MQHTLYQTEAIIIGSRNVGESNKSISLFTKMAGLIHAHAQSIRDMESKLRYSIQGPSFIKAQIVRGREVWRLINVEEDLCFPSIVENKKKKIILYRILSVVKQFVLGEENHAFLYDDIKNGVCFLENENDIDILDSFERVIILRIMHSLGYVPKDKSISRILNFSDWDREFVKNANSKKKDMITAINRSFVESGL